MPFGAIFGGLFLALFALWLVLAGIDTPAGPLMPTRLLLAVASVSLALGLLLRRGWARWASVAFVTGLAVASTRAALAGWGVLPLVFVLGSLTCLALLLAPQAPSPSTPPWPRLGRLLGWSAALGSLAAAASLTFIDWPHGVPLLPGAVGESSRVASVRPQRVGWSDFTSGVERAAAEQKPVVVNFTASWCGYCKQMDRTTWRDPAVIERLEGVVPVRVDVDETRAPRGGEPGADVANRYGVRGTPTLLVLDGQGRVLSRTSGYHDAHQLLDWLDGSLATRPARRPVDAVQVSTP